MSNVQKFRPRKWSFSAVQGLRNLKNGHFQQSEAYGSSKMVIFSLSEAYGSSKTVIFALAKVMLGSKSTVCTHKT